MSLSETQFSVDAGADVETFIVSPSYAVLQRGVGKFSGKLTPGIYKVKFRRGTVTHEQFFEIPAVATGIVVLKPSVPLMYESAVPTLESGATDTSRKQVAAARDLSRRTQRSASGSNIYLFFHRNPDAPPLDLRLRLYTLDEQLVGDMQKNAECDDAANPTFAALSTDVPPGAYRLRCGDGDDVLEQIVIACSGWQTQVFLTPQAEEEGDDPTPLAAASILMGRDGFDPANPLLQLAEAARVALRYERTTMSRELLTRLVNEKFESPMLGIYAAHALAASGTRDPLLEQVLDTLESQVPGHPDVAALRIGTGPQVEIDVPPMLRSSWRAITAGSLDDSVHIQEGSLASRLPASLWPGTPWLLWSQRDLLPLLDTGDVGASLSEISAALGTAADAMPSDLTNSEEALFSYLVRRSSSDFTSSLESLERPLDDRAIARAFGTTVAQVKNTVSGLAGKLRMTKVSSSE